MDLIEARVWLLHIQTKPHQWAKNDPNKRFDDLFNLVCNPATLAVAWDRVRSNKGSKTAGVDGVTKYYIERRLGSARFLAELRAALRNRTYRSRPVRRHGIPKPGGKVRYLGIPTIRDRVVQMALKLILEPIFEADFVTTSYGFRPNRRAQDAVAEVYHFVKAPSNYEYVVEGDIEACSDGSSSGTPGAATRHSPRMPPPRSTTSSCCTRASVPPHGAADRLRPAHGAPTNGILQTKAGSNYASRAPSMLAALISR